jgi:hypothetical protein
VPPVVSSGGMGADDGDHEEFVQQIKAEIQGLADEIACLATAKDGIDRAEAERLMQSTGGRSGGCGCICRRSRPGDKRAAALEVRASTAAAPSPARLLARHIRSSIAGWAS